MKKYTTIISVLLAVAMLFSALPMTAFAAEADSAETAASVDGELFSVGDQPEDADAYDDTLPDAVDVPEDAPAGTDISVFSDKEMPADTGAHFDEADLGFISEFADLGDQPLNIRDISTAEQLKDALEWPDTGRINVLYLTQNIYETIGTPGDHTSANYIPYWATVAKGKKILVLNGYNLILKSDYTACASHPYAEQNDYNTETLIRVPSAAELNVIGMDKDRNYSTMRYDGAILYKCDANDNRDLFHVDGGNLIFNGGYYRIDPQTMKYASGNSDFDYYWFQMHGTSVQVNSGRLTINSGSFEGRGFMEHIRKTMNIGMINGAIEINGDPSYVSVDINDGHFAGSSKAQLVHCLNAEMFASGRVNIRAGVFEMDRNRAHVSTHYLNGPLGHTEDVSGLGMKICNFSDYANYYFYDAGAYVDHYDARKYTELEKKNGFQFFAVNPMKDNDEFKDLPNGPTAMLDHHHGTMYARSEDNRFLPAWDGKSSYSVYVDAENLYFPIVRYREDTTVEDGYGYKANSLAGMIRITDSAGNVINDSITSKSLKLHFDKNAEEYYFDLKDQLTNAQRAKLKRGETYQVKITYNEKYAGFYDYAIKHQAQFRLEIDSPLTAVYATVPKPKAGDHPVTTVAGTDDYDVSVAYKRRGGSTVLPTSVFDENTQYFVDVTFTPKGDAAFSTDGVTCVINGFMRYVTEQSADKVVCTLRMDTTEDLKPITNATVLIDEPQLTAVLPTTATPVGDGSYSAKIVEWRLVSNDHVLPANSRFTAGETYRVFVDINPDPGYQLGIESVGVMTVKINDKPAKLANNGLYYVDFEFPSEYDEASCTVTAPVAGMHPEFDAVTPADADHRYACTVSKWLDYYDHEMTEDVIFKKENTYRCVVLFVCVGGSALSDTANVTINGIKATKLDKDHYYVDFKTTGTWSIEEAKAYVYEPYAGQHPDTYVDCASENMSYLEVSNVEWMSITKDSDGEINEEMLAPEDIYLPSHTYRCTVWFEPKEGYEFSSQTKFYINNIEAKRYDSRPVWYVDFKTPAIYNTVDKIELEGFSTPKPGQSAKNNGMWSGYRFKDIVTSDGTYTYEIYSVPTGDYPNRKAEWLDADGNLFTGAFEGGKEYTLKILALTLSSCRFAEEGKLRATMDGVEADVERTSNTVAYVKFTVTVPEAENFISNVNATVHAPSPGSSPSKDITDDNDHCNSTVLGWYFTGTDTPPYSTFDKNKIYDVVVKFTARTDYAFEPTAKFTVNGLEGKDVSRNTSEVVVRVTFEPTYVSKMSATITPPEDGAAQSFNGEPGDPAAYSITGVTWHYKGHKEQMSPAEHFYAGYTYTAEVDFKLNENYEADGDTTFEINGVAADKVVWADPSTHRSASAMLDFTVSAPADSSTITEAAATVTAPASGAELDYTAASGDSTKYDTAVSQWYLSGNDVPLASDETFFAGLSYDVVVNFTAMPGYNFSADTAFTVNGQPAEVVTSGTGLKKVKATFTVPDSSDGITISGKVTRYLDESEMTNLRLIDSSNDAILDETSVLVEEDYKFRNVADGTYILRVSKKNHVTRDYEVTVAGASVTQDVKICPIGDVDNNGKVNSADAKAAFRHSNDEKPITDEYKFACADVVAPKKKVNSADAKAIFQHANEQKSLWID